MGKRANQCLASTRAMPQERDEVRHRAARNHDGRLLAGNPRGHLLEPVNAGILAVNVVAEFGARYRFAHLVAGQGYGVAAKIDTVGGSKCRCPRFDAQRHRGPRPAQGKIARTTSPIARLLSLSSVSDQVTATVAARCGAIP